MEMLSTRNFQKPNDSFWSISLKTAKSYKSKVFLFGEDSWLYCGDITFKDGIYKAHVINGSWFLVYDTKDKTLKAYRSAEDKRLDYLPVTQSIAELTWACDPRGKGYTDVLENAKERYKSGERANFGLVEHIYIEEDGIPF